jgi:hypothetical protein
MSLVATASGCVLYLASYPVELSDRTAILTTQLHTLARLKYLKLYLLSPYVSMLRCLIKHRDGFSCFNSEYTSKCPYLLE